jgi:serine/threonine-protein kinase RsbW
MSKSQMQPRPSLDHGATSFPEESATALNTKIGANVPAAVPLPGPGPDSIVLHIPSRPEYVRVVRLALLGIASRMEFSFDDVEDMKLAVSEACNNAILHAAPNTADCDTAEGKQNPNQSSAINNLAGTARKSGSFMVAVTPYDNRLEITVVDEGCIAPPGLPRQSATPQHGIDEELRESGLGLYLMQSLMDEVEHHTGENSQTVVRLVKYLPSYRIQVEVEANSQL